MTEKPVPPKTLSEKNTKQEMLDAYRVLVRQLQEKRAAELNPEKRLQEKQNEEAVAVAVELAPEGVERALGNLKADIGQSLAQIAERMASEVTRFKAVQKAVESKERELQELYGIEKAATSLAALIEAQQQKRRDFETELGQQKEELAREIESARVEWEKERKNHDADLREREAVIPHDGTDEHWDVRHVATLSIFVASCSPMASTRSARYWAGGQFVGDRLVGLELFERFVDGLGQVIAGELVPLRRIER